MKITCGQCGWEWNCQGGLQLGLAEADPECVRCTACRADECAARLRHQLGRATLRAISIRRSRMDRAERKRGETG